MILFIKITCTADNKLQCAGYNETFLLYLLGLYSCNTGRCTDA